MSTSPRHRIAAGSVSHDLLRYAHAYRTRFPGATSGVHRLLAERQVLIETLRAVDTDLTEHGELSDGTASIVRVVLDDQTVGIGGH